jgi:hypothetical protein
VYILLNLSISQVGKIDSPKDEMDEEEEEISYP